ncbi:hypothetical protein [Wolinella succinogenes]|uniref:hypothetical protein n=1 Tax=Wolinella succinogenes TaxID=844 RepID=UPI0024096F1B|nr:hypothetical protein [Wolinella succinogenes]
MEEEVEIEEKKRSSAVFYIFLFTFLLLVVLGSVYYVFWAKSKDKPLFGGGSAPVEKPILPALSSESASPELERLKIELESKQKQIERLSGSLAGVKSEQDSVKIKLQYTLKPKERIITECYAMNVGFWAIPENCALSLAANVNKELEEDKRVVAFEVQGIVDSTPYRGLSPELKQEGLASFRAREAIRMIQEKLPRAVVFEGPSVQEANHRGYRIKAYFVE